jgi:hypothetical protein
MDLSLAVETSIQLASFLHESAPAAVDLEELVVASACLTPYHGSSGTINVPMVSYAC